MDSLFSKSFDNADEVKAPPKTQASIVKLGGITATRVVLEPGWRWSECVKPALGVDGSCPAGHVGVIVQGQMHCAHDDGTEITVSAGEAFYFSPGHDGWVVGDEPVIGYEFSDAGKDFGPWRTA